MHEPESAESNMIGLRPHCASKMECVNGAGKFAPAASNEMIKSPTVHNEVLASPRQLEHGDRGTGTAWSEFETTVI